MDSRFTHDVAGEAHPPATIAVRDRRIGDISGISEWGEAVGGIENLCLVQHCRWRTVVASNHLNIVTLCTHWVTGARCNSGFFFYNPRNRTREISRGEAYEKTSAVGGCGGVRVGGVGGR